MRVLAGLLTAALAALPRPAAPTALRFGHAWDGARLLDDVLFTIDGDKTVSVATGRTDLPGGAIDLRRYTALPGLIDLHTHVTYYWDGKPGSVTTIRDLGASGESDYATRDLVAMGR